LTGWNVLTSLLFYMAVYLIIFPAGAFVMLRIIRKGPHDASPDDEADDEPLIEGGRPSQPVTVELHPHGGL
jgi:cytochrome d ubiquinol oxidase subunit I